MIQTEFRARGITAGGGIRKRYDFRTSPCLYGKEGISVQPICTHYGQSESLFVDQDPLRRRPGKSTAR